MKNSITFPFDPSIEIPFVAGSARCGEKSAEFQVKVDRKEESQARRSSSPNYSRTDHSGKHGGE